MKVTLKKSIIAEVKTAVKTYCIASNKADTSKTNNNRKPRVRRSSGHVRVVSGETVTHVQCGAIKRRPNKDKPVVTVT